MKKVIAILCFALCVFFTALTIVVSIQTGYIYWLNMVVGLAGAVGSAIGVTHGH